MSKSTNYVVAAVGIGTLLFAVLKNASPAPGTVVTVQAGKRYRFTASAVPNLTDDDISKLQAAMTLTGVTNFKFSQRSNETRVTYDAPPAPMGTTYTIGDNATIPVIGGTWTLDDITEIKS